MNFEYKKTPNICCLCVVTFFCMVAGNVSVAQNLNPRFGTGDNIMLVGDSFSNDGITEWAGKVDRNADFSLDFFSAGGRSIRRMDELFSSQYTPDTFDAVVIAGGINDITGLRATPSEILDSIESIIAQTNGEHIILTTLPPFAGNSAWTPTLQARADEVDRLVTNLAMNSPSVSLFDIRSVLDTDNDQVIDPELASSDNFHPRGCPLSAVCGQSVIADNFINQFEEVILGDLNQDGIVNSEDISSFIVVILSGDFQAEADCNEDGDVNFGDVGVFIQLLLID